MTKMIVVIPEFSYLLLHRNCLVGLKPFFPRIFDVFVV